MQFFSDLAVSGIVHWDQSTGEVRADLKLTGLNRTAGELDIRWNSRQTNAMAHELLGT